MTIPFWDPSSFFGPETFPRSMELRINKGTVCLPLMGRGDFSRPYLGRLKPPLPETKAKKKFHYVCEAHY